VSDSKHHETRNALNVTTESQRRANSEFEYFLVKGSTPSSGQVCVV